MEKKSGSKKGKKKVFCNCLVIVPIVLMENFQTRIDVQTIKDEDPSLFIIFLFVYLFFFFFLFAFED